MDGDGGREARLRPRRRMRVRCEHGVVFRSLDGGADGEVDGEVCDPEKGPEKGGRGGGGVP